MPRKSKDIQYYEAVGRRKSAVARVRLYIPGKDKSATINGKKISEGQVFVNDQLIDKEIPRIVDRKKCLQPLELTNNLDRFAISIKINGGGPNGQVEAIAHGIARALTVVNPEEYKSVLRENSLLTRDPRTRERRKVGTGGKARRAKQSPKR
jgi:small subunit ribosomal protein S9